MGHLIKDFCTLGREGANNDTGKSGQGEGRDLAVCGHPFQCGLWKREEGT